MSSPAKPAKEAKDSHAKDVPAKSATPIDEAIEIALAAAGTATDAAQEIQRLRKQVSTHITGTKKASMILLYSGILVLVLSGASLATSIIMYQQSLNRFDGITKVNREALTVFADEINGLTASAKRLEEASTTTVQALGIVTTRTDEVKKAYQQLLTTQNALNAKLDSVSTMGDKLPATFKAAVDELSNANKAAIAQLNDAVSKAAAGPAREAAGKVDTVAQSQRTLAERLQKLERVQPKPTATRKPREAEAQIRYP